MSLFSHPNALKIYGPPGAGKTRELIRILGEHVADGDFELGEGIIISFTRAAAYDIARRVNPGEAPARYHTTLHALCKRFYGFDGPLAEKHLKEFFAEHNIDYTPGRMGDGEEWAASEEWAKSEGGALMSFFTLCRNRMVSISEGKKLFPVPEEAASWEEDDRLEKLWKEYCDWKAANGLADFTDWLEHALQHPPRHTTWPFLVLDEAQDSSPLQWSVAQVFAARAEVVYLAADEDQALYGWMGASPTDFLEAKTAAQDVLHVNHRSGSVLVDRAQEFIRKNKRRQDKAMVAAREGGEIRGATSLTSEMLDVGRSTFIMARAHYLNEPLMKQLTQLHHPFVDKRGKYGVTGEAALAYQRFLRLHRGHAITVEELRRLYGEIRSRGPWLLWGAKKQLSAMDAYQREHSIVRVGDLTEYGATEDLVNAIRKGSTAPLGSIPVERLDYLEGVARLHGEEYLDERKAGQVCAVGPIHAFKGLECDDAIVHTGMSPASMREAYNDPEPERRVFYVAMTRPRETLTWWMGQAFGQYDQVL